MLCGQWDQSNIPTPHIAASFNAHSHIPMTRVCGCANVGIRFSGQKHCTDVNFTAFVHAQGMLNIEYERVSSTSDRISSSEALVIGGQTIKRRADGYIDATSLCRASCTDKVVGDWNRLAKTQGILIFRF